jgi:hypothetical protein
MACGNWRVVLWRAARGGLGLISEALKDGVYFEAGDMMAWSAGVWDTRMG